MTRPPTILIVDDEAGIRRSLRALLNGKFGVILCGTGREALQFVSDHPGEVFAAFVDYAMPGMDGNAVCAGIRSLDQTITLVGFSAHENAPFTVPLFARFVKNNGSMTNVHALAADAVARSTELRCH